MTIMNKVILDANFLLVPSQFHIDIYNELRMQLSGTLQILIIPEVLEELNRKSLETTSTKFIRHVKMAMEILDRYQLNFPKIFKKTQRNNSKNLPVDDYLISIAQNLHGGKDEIVFIASNDKELRKKASKRGIRTIYLRQKKFLEISP